MPYEKDFMDSDEYSLFKKMKYKFIMLLIKMNASKRVVSIIGDLTILSIKQKIRSII